MVHGAQASQHADLVLVVSTNVFVRALAHTLADVAVGCRGVSLSQAIDACSENAHIVVTECARPNSELAHTIGTIATFHPHSVPIVVTPEVPREHDWMFWCAAGATHVIPVQWLDVLKAIICSLTERVILSTPPSRLALEHGGTIDLGRGRYVGLRTPVRLSDMEMAFIQAWLEASSAGQDGWATAASICRRWPNKRRPNARHVPPLVFRLIEKMRKADGVDSETDRPVLVARKKGYGYRFILREEAPAANSAVRTITTRFPHISDANS